MPNNPHAVVISEELGARDIVTPENVSVTIFQLELPSIAVAAAAADLIEHWWWVNRVIVRRPDMRGKGVGSLALTRLLQNIARQSHLPVRVVPGGYGSDSAKQWNFYVKNGFVGLDGQFKGALEWRAPC